MKILDTTIRDGSYAVDFKFTCEDVQRIVKNSAQLGIEYIEVGHGLGLDASSEQYGVAIHTDEEYIVAAKETAGLSKVGVFCIPGIARISSIRIAKEHGIDFIRIGFNADQYDEARPYIEEAKRQGLEVMTNLMKSYIVKPKEFADIAIEIEKTGAAAIYIVDSAGCMTEKDIEPYIFETREKTELALGFHGHNNMGLAVSNSVFCVEHGVEFIDCSYQGLGRSAGNASLEQVVMTLVRLGYDVDIDIPCLLEFGYSSLVDILGNARVHPLDMCCGFAGFHSGYLKQIYRCCMEKRIDPMRLIIEYSKYNKKTLEYSCLCDVADTIPKDLQDNPYSFKKYFSPGYIQ